MTSENRTTSEAYQPTAYDLARRKFPYVGEPDAEGRVQWSPSDIEQGLPDANVVFNYTEVRRADNTLMVNSEGLPIFRCNSYFAMPDGVNH